MATMSYQLLGRLMVLRDGVRVDLGPEQRQRILAALLLKSNQAVSSAELVSAGWIDEPPADAEEVVAEHLAVLRELVGPSRGQGVAESLITLADGNYLLCVEPGASDLSQFSSLVAEAWELKAGGNYRLASAKLRTALGLWRGVPLEGLSGELFDEARPRLDEARRQAQETLDQIEPGSVPQVVSPVPQSPTSRPDPPRAPTPWPASMPGYGPDQAVNTSPRSTAALVALKLLGAAVPVVTIGFFGWVLTAGVAIKRRSALLGISAVVYLAITVWFTAYVVVPEGPEITDSQGLVGLLYFAAGIVCAVQAAVVIGSPNQRGGQRPPYLLRPQTQYQVPPPEYRVPQPSVCYPPAPSADAVLRNQARQLAATQPALARSLGIGRPDLPRQYDDGGLIDLNDAPADLLDTLPGVTGRQAASIVVSRTQTGRFRSIDELWTRGLLPAHLAPQLVDRLVIIDIQDTAGRLG
jgi:hypothetical protein